MKLLHIFQSETKPEVVVKVHRDRETGEYVARLFLGGVEVKSASYHDDDYASVVGTAHAMVARLEAE